MSTLRRGHRAPASAARSGRGNHRLLLVDPSTVDLWDLARDAARENPRRRVVVVVDGPLARLVAERKLGRPTDSPVPAHIDVVTVADLTADRTPLDDAVVIFDVFRSRSPQVDRSLLMGLLDRAEQVVMGTVPPTPATAD